MRRAKQEHLVIGMGQIGSAIAAVLQDNRKNTISGIDKDGVIGSKFDVVHICFPYSRRFKRQVKQYIAQYLKVYGLVIIHSTVPCGTTDKIGDYVVHSPVRGVHPHLYEGIKTFVKFFGGKRAIEASKIFIKCKVKIAFSNNAVDTELLKLLDTTAYGWNIIFNKWAMKMCRKYDANFNFVYTLGTETYNQGYAKLGRKDVVRPVLNYIPGKIGGHCILSNCKLLGGVISLVIVYLDKIYGKMK